MPGVYKTLLLLGARGWAGDASGFCPNMLAITSSIELGSSELIIFPVELDGSFGVFRGCEECMFAGVCCVVELALVSRALPGPVLWDFPSSLRWVLFSRRMIGVCQVCIII